MQSALKFLKSDCDNDVECRIRTSKEKAAIHRADMPLIWLILLMLVTTIIYMAWSINKIHEMNHSINSIHKEKSEAERKADFFLESVSRKKK